MRLFVALTLEASLGEVLAGWVRRSVPGEGLRRLQAGGLHCTLCFLGERPERELGRLIPALGSVECHTAIRGALGAPVWLPAHRPRALAVEVTGEDIPELQREVSAALFDAVGWRAERRRYRPHVTLARIRPGSEPLAIGTPMPARTFCASSLGLYRSQLTREGALHEALFALALPQPRTWDDR